MIGLLIFMYFTVPLILLVVLMLAGGIAAIHSIIQSYFARRSWKMTDKQMDDALRRYYRS